MAADALPGTDIDLRGARLLLVAPHPDDESLAAGGLLQQAVRQGAAVTVLQVTDGDNNPWPQRWLERRWRIGPRDRARWGRRRVDEVHAAMRCLGLPAAALQRLGWPDLGVNARLLDDPAAAIDAFAGVVRAGAPDIVVLPDLGDGHPDHGACHVLARLALQREGIHPACLTYLVHGRAAAGQGSCDVTLDARTQEAKRCAVVAHATQIALARRRLLAMVGPTERFGRLPDPALARNAVPPASIALPWNPPRHLRPWLRLTLAHPGGACAWSWRRAPVLRAGAGWQLALPECVRQYPVFARLELRRTALWIFGHWGWRDLTAGTFAGQAGDS